MGSSRETAHASTPAAISGTSFKNIKKGKRIRKMTQKTVFVFAFCVLFFAIDVESKPQFNLGALFGNAVSSTFNTAFGRDCRGRPQGDYFFGCQCVGPFSVGRKKRSPIFLNSNQGVGGDFLRSLLDLLV